MTKKQTTVDRNIVRVIELCNEMINLADQGDDYRLDDDCSMFNRALRDSAYKLRRLAKNELVRHQSVRQVLS